MTYANWSYPTAIRFGAGRLSELADACAAAGISRPLLVTDPGLAALPMTARALDILEARGLGRAIFGEVAANPVEANMLAGVEAFRKGGHDGVVAFGGGSALDCGKLIAFMAGQTRPVWNFEDVGDWWTRADADAIAPVVAVPTTAGTGSEVGRAAVVTNEATHEKKIIFHPKMLPAVVLADPELTVGMPPFITVGTGMDALAHCLEAYCAPSFHPMSEGIALEGMRLVKENLPVVFEHGDDVEARGLMLVAAAMGAVAFQKGLGAVHSLSHPVGARYNTHHGMTNAVYLPYVLAFNRPVIEEKLVRLGAFLGLGDSGYSAVFDWVLGFREFLGVPHTLADLGVGEADVAAIAKSAVADPSTGGNPRELTEAAAARIFEAAMTGSFEGLSRRRQGATTCPRQSRSSS